MRTLENALGYFYDSIPDDEMEELFDLIDTDQDGTIAYQDYLKFLKQYFGSESQASTLPLSESRNKEAISFKKEYAVELLTQALSEVSKTE